VAKAFSGLGATVVDTSADLPAASADLEGMMVFQKDSNELKICDGSSWVSVVDTDTPNGLVFIKAQTFSSVSSVNVNNVFSSSFDNYKMLVNVTGNTINGPIYMRMRSGGVDTATSVYTWAGLNSYSGSAITSHVGSGGTQTYFFVSGAHATNYTNMPFTFEILQPYATYRTTIYGLHPNPVTPQSYFNYLGGAMNNTTSYDGLTLYHGSGGNLSGVVRIYGYRNSI